MAHVTSVESVISFECAQSLLWGVVSQPPPERSPSPIAVVIVVGGPQYRVGSHRQFVQLARGLAGRGFPVLRFDYRGMGDSEGDCRSFESVGPDLQAAFDAVCRACPGTRHIVVWGLCDAASAAMMFAGSDPRVLGIVAANPWVRSEVSLAAAQVKHYYAARLLHRDFWSRLIRGRFDWRASWKSLARNLALAVAHHRPSRDVQAVEPFQTLMARGLADFRGQVMLVLSGNDLTAKEFLEYAGTASAWRGLLGDPKLRRVDLPEADHTFSRGVWLDRVEAETAAWLHALQVASAAKPTARAIAGGHGASCMSRSKNTMNEGT